jgi:hypothetical protein
MLVIPLQTKDNARDAVFVVLDPEQLPRLEQGDPADIVLRQTGNRLVNPTVVICLEKPTPEFNRLVQSGDIRALIAYLQRGWKFRPELGDHDRGPESVFQSN